MASDDNDGDANGDEAPDEWDDFREEDGDPIGIEELKRLDLREMPEDVRVWVMDNYFPEATVRRDGEILICETQEHLYTKYWEHKFSAYAFAEAMERAARMRGNFHVRFLGAGSEQSHPATRPTSS
ncbi:MAG TPA: hypothetical protein VGL29_04680 [Blastocatellia bacterium]